MARALSVTVKVPAKINLHLAVGPRRDDGYHPLVTVYQAVSLFDQVTVRPAAQPSMTVIGAESQGVPRDGQNLARQAVDLLAAELGIDDPVEIVLNKAIPVAGGMAGGSADAAGALLAAVHLWEAVDEVDVAELAARLGSDVPFALVGGTALGTGRGEHVTPVLSTGRFHWVLALADGGLSTPEVFAEFDRMASVAGTLEANGALPVALEPADPSDVLAAVRSGQAAELADRLGNDLTAAAVRLRPDLRRTLAVGQELGALAGLLSGSGPTCVFLAVDQGHAIRLAAELSGAGVCRSVRIVHGPVAGARIMPPAPD